MYFLSLHWTPAIWHIRTWTSGRYAVRGTAHHTGAAADLPVYPSDDIIGADADLVSTEKIAVGESLLNTALHLLSGLPTADRMECVRTVFFDPVHDLIDRFCPWISFPSPIKIEVRYGNVKVQCHFAVSFLRDLLIHLQKFSYIATDRFRHNDRLSATIMANLVVYWQLIYRNFEGLEKIQLEDQSQMHLSSSKLHKVARSQPVFVSKHFIKIEFVRYSSWIRIPIRCLRQAAPGATHPDLPAFSRAGPSANRQEKARAD